MNSRSNNSRVMPGNLSKHKWIMDLSIEDIPSNQMRAIANCCGITDAISLMLNLPGIEVYIPSLCKKRMDLQYIKNNFTGKNISAIAVHLGKDRSEIQKMVKKPIKAIAGKEILFNKEMDMVVSKCGREIAVRLIQNYKKLLSNRFYIPKNGFRIAKERCIQRNFSGSNIKELALQYEVSDRFIYKVISNMYRQKHRNKKELK